MAADVSPLETEPGRAGAPCRLFVYLAKDAPVGVVLRRGPTAWSRLSLWQTDTDHIDHGQWIKGRVYERRSDVSHDGSLFAAFVRQSGGRSEHPRGSDTWIAVSRPPYFSALALWFIGGTYYTGGFFPRPGELWLGFLDEPTPDIGSLPPWLRTSEPRDIAYVDGSPDWTERTVHFNRLLRDGWALADRDPHASLWQRRHPVHRQTLVMLHAFDDFARFGGPYALDFSIIDAAGVEHRLGEATWADWDQRGRLAMARNGRLLVSDDGTSFREIADFNGQTPDPQPAPEQARAWPPSRNGAHGRGDRSPRLTPD